MSGTEQRDRLPSALDSSYFRVDETSFEQLASAAAQLAAHLRFHPAGPRGADTVATWGSLFDADELLVMASILHYDARPVEEALLEDFSATPASRMAAEVVRLAMVIDRWLRTLRLIDAPGARTLASAIEQLIGRQLAGELQWVARHALPTGWRGEIKGYEQQRLGAGWFDAAAVPPVDRGRPQRDGLRSRFFAFKDGIARIQETARVQVGVSRTSQRHDPAAALLVAFFELYGTVQRRINGFTARHTDFYYHDVLDMRPKRASRDRIHLVCEPVPGPQPEVLIARGTAFAAGLGPNKQPIEFLAENDLLVTDIKVAALRSVRLESANLLLGEDQACYPVKRVRVDEPAPPGDLQPGAAQRFWPLFGGSQGREESARDGELGLAFASPVLWLKEGLREIQIRLMFREVAGPANAASQLWSRIDDEDDRVRWQLARALPQLFSISLTTATGWYEALEAFACRPVAAPDAALSCLEVTVRLRPEAPAITGCVTALHGAQWDTTLPMVRLCARQSAALCAYSLLENKELVDVLIDVSVQGVRDIAVGNNFGRLDPSKPFMPFGPLPAKGSYLVFGSAEAARKELKSLKLHLEWSGLPQDLGGFPEHYDGYDSEFTNSGFRGTVSVLQDGHWRVAPDEAMGQRLFTQGPGGRLESGTTIAVSPAALQSYFKSCTPAAGRDFTFDAGTDNGFFRLELRKPDAAFGHAEYPHVLTRVVSANVRRKKPLPMPLAPYTPTLERVTLDYEAQDAIHLHADKSGARSAGPDESRAWHLHPFGIEQLNEASRTAAVMLLPAWPQDGNLYIGLAGEQIEGALSLLFELRGESAVPAPNRQARVSWHYLSSNRWFELEASRVLADSTDGFLTSGIVRLDLPAAIARDNTVMPHGLCWLRVSADADYEAFAALYSVRAQAVAAVRSPASPLPMEYEVMRAASCTGPVVSISGLAKVTQVGNSFDLRPQESLQQLRVRTGERLKHKNRALLPWDYERLVLERFPSVFKVRCFPNLRAPEATRNPGHVLVVVVPQLGSVDQLKNVRGPRLNAEELHRIAVYLRALAPPFANIEVRNASYEMIQVRCAVALKPGANSGLAIRRLNAALFDYLSPWNDNGYRANFGWTVRPEDLEARIREFDVVLQVSQVSLLHVAASDEKVYMLGDTARPGPFSAEAIAGQVSSRWPWSIAVPMRRHLIGLLGASETSKPVPTGFDRLEIGNTFIVGGAVG
jgi:hypothetical protein